MRWRRREQIRIGDDLAHQRQTLSMPLSEPGSRVRSIGIVTGKDELSLGKPVHQCRQQSAHDLRSGAVTTSLGEVRFLVSI